MLSTNFSEIVNKFDTIVSVTNHSTKPIVAVTGYINGELKGEKFEYKHYEVMQEVSKKVSYFIGVK